MLPCILRTIGSQPTMSFEVPCISWVCFKYEVIITLYLGQLYWYVPWNSVLGKQVYNNTHFAILSKLLHCASVTFHY